MHVSDKALYSLYWTDSTGFQHLEIQHSPIDDKFKSAVLRLTEGPGALIAEIKEVKITDAMDCLAAHWDVKNRKRLW
jgi:hypothetical protein